MKKIPNNPTNKRNPVNNQYIQQDPVRKNAQYTNIYTKPSKETTKDTDIDTPTCI